MHYHQLGGSGLQVARIGLGCIPFGTTIDQQASRRVVDRYLDAGGNYLDTANVYGGGMRGSHERDAGTSERTVGAVVAGRRHRFLIGTGRWPTSPWPGCCRAAAATWRCWARSLPSSSTTDWARWS